jgi:hypothetical protein
MIEWECQEQEKAEEGVQNWISNLKEQDLDPAHRRWAYIQLRDQIASKARKEEMSNFYGRIFWPNDWEKATPYNCFWLRFPDCSPLMPWRQYKTFTMVDEWHKVPFHFIQFRVVKMFSLDDQEEVWVC